MKNKFYVVFDIKPHYEGGGREAYYVLEKIAQFKTELEALQHIDNTSQGYGLTILPVWE